MHKALVVFESPTRYLDLRRDFRSIATYGRGVISTRHPRATLVATILGSSLAFIDGSVVNIALPALELGLRASPSNLPWAINAYLLPLGALILLGGGLGDRFGRLRWFLVGLVTFTIASIVCAGAMSLPWLLCGRALQGLGAALLLPNSLAILGSAFEGHARARAIGTWAAAGALTSALGPIVGGLLIDMLGWRAIFVINVPLAAAAGYIAWNYVIERTESRHTEPLDYLGAGYATVALGLLAWSLTEASRPQAAWTLPSFSAACGALLLILFLWHEKRVQDRALMPFAMFAEPTFVGLNLSTFFLYGSLGGLMVMLPFFLIRMGHWSAVAAGAALLPLPLSIGVGSQLMGRLASGHGARLPLAIGSGIVALGLALYTRIGTEAIGYWRDAFPPTLLVSLGMAICVAPLTTSVMASVSPTRVGAAAGFNSAVARVAGLIATALLSFVFSRQGSVEAFLVAFRTAAVIGAISAAAACASALWLIRAPSNQAGNDERSEAGM